MKKRREGLKWDRIKSGMFVWIILIPILIQYTLTSVVPMLVSFFLTFTDWNLVGTWNFVGLDNWKRLFSDQAVWHSLKVSVLYALYSVIPTVVIGLLLALAVNTKKKGTAFFKSVWFFPVITSVVVVASIWKWMFTAEADGIINQVLGFFGIEPRFFFGTRLALVTVALLGIYQSVGTAMVYYYAGLKGIDTNLHEAAKVDGCTGAQVFFHITLPLLRPTMAYVLITLTSGALKVFDSVYTLYNQTGGPQNAANTLVMHVYRTGFFNMQMGYASTIAYLLFVIIMAISVIQYQVTNRDVE